MSDQEVKEFVRGANRNFKRFLNGRNLFPPYINNFELEREEKGVRDYHTKIYIPTRTSKGVEFTCDYVGPPLAFNVLLWNMLSLPELEFKRFEKTREKLERAIGRGSIKDFGLVDEDLKIEIYRQIDVSSLDEVMGMQEAFLAAKDKVLTPLIKYFFRVKGWK